MKGTRCTCVQQADAPVSLKIRDEGHNSIKTNAAQQVWRTGQKCWQRCQSSHMQNGELISKNADALCKPSWHWTAWQHSWVIKQQDIRGERKSNHTWKLNKNAAEGVAVRVSKYEYVQGRWGGCCGSSSAEMSRGKPAWVGSAQGYQCGSVLLQSTYVF
jgi:hypothetical protein